MSAPRAYHWLCLTGAVFFEVAGTTLMKASQSWSMVFGAEAGVVIMLLFIGVSYYLLSLSTTALPVGVAFAFWEGVGLAFITLASVFILGEQMSLLRFAALCAVLGGVLLVHHGTSSGNRQQAEPAGAVQPRRGEQS